MLKRQKADNALNVIRTEITYMNIRTCYFVPLTPSSFYKAQDLSHKTISNKIMSDSINYFLSKLLTNNKAQFQDEIDPRIAIKITYEDSSKKNIFIDFGGEYMLKLFKVDVIKLQ